MDKEMARLLVLQAASFISIFGWASPRLRAAASLLNFLATEKWDEVWALFSNSGLVSTLANIANIKDDPFAWTDNFKLVTKC